MNRIDSRGETAGNLLVADSTEMIDFYRSRFVKDFQFSQKNIPLGVFAERGCFAEKILFPHSKSDTVMKLNYDVNKGEIEKFLVRDFIQILFYF